MYTKLKACVIVLFLILALSAAGIFIGSYITKGESHDVIPSDDPISSRSDGTLYDELSKNVSITIYPARVFAEDGQRKIGYYFTITNKSEHELKDFRATVAMNPLLDQYMAAGVSPFPITTVTLASPFSETKSKHEAYGMNVNFIQLLATNEFLAEAGLKMESIWTHAEQFSLILEWAEGSEEYTFQTNVINALSEG